MRTTETKTCDDCHVSAANDNNAIMAQLMLLGTNFVNFVGMHAWVGLDGGIEAVRVTEWSEPQAVFGSYLQKYAYPDYYRLHVERNHRELVNWTRGRCVDGKCSATPTRPNRSSIPPSHRRPRPLSAAARRVHLCGGRIRRFPRL